MFVMISPIKRLKKYFSGTFLVLIFVLNMPQKGICQHDTTMLLTNMYIQIEATDGVNNMYNFNFKYAESQFNYLKKKYPDHPLPFFLLAQCQWWRIFPNIDNQSFDKKFHAYMDSCIYYAEIIHKKNPKNPEATFFLAAAYASQSRLYSERSNWTKAAGTAKKALNYLELNREQNDLSPEFLFGDGLYNYYSIWIPENYPELKPLLMLFRKGDQALGLKQLEQVSQDAFYTKTEAQLFLMRIYATETNDIFKATLISEYLYKTYPNNAYFHRYYARLLYEQGQYRQLEPVAQEILTRLDSGYYGYEVVSARYAAFYLASIYQYYHRDILKAVNYYKMVLAFTELNRDYDSGYYLSSLAHLARIAKDNKLYEMASVFYEKILKYTKKDHNLNKEAKTFLSNYKKGKVQ